MTIQEHIAALLELIAHRGDSPAAATEWRIGMAVSAPPLLKLLAAMLEERERFESGCDNCGECVQTSAASRALAEAEAALCPLEVEATHE